MSSKKYFIPLIVSILAITIGGVAMTYNIFKPKNETAKLNLSSAPSSSNSSQPLSYSSQSKSSSSLGSTISQNSSSSNSSQVEIKKVPVEVESSEKEEPNETKSNPIQSSQPLAKIANNNQDNCTLPDLAGYDVLLTEKGCLYFKQKFEGNNYAWEWSPDFVAKDRSKLTKVLQDIAGIQYDKYINQMHNKNAPLVIRGYVDPVNAQKSIAIGFSDPMANIATD